MEVSQQIKTYGQHSDSTANALIIMCGVLLSVMAVFPAAANVCAILMLPCIGLLFFHDDFYVVAAIFIFFTEQLTVTASAPIARVYQYLLFARFILYDMKGLKFRAWIFPAFLVFALYGVFVMPNADVSNIIKLFEERNQQPPTVMVLKGQLVLKYFSDMLYMLIIATKLYTDKRLLDRFLKAVVFIAIASGVYGLRANNIFNYKVGYVAGGTRQMMSFNDPNYASFFVNMAIFIVFVKIHNKPLKFALLAVLYAFLVGAGSMTGFLLNVTGAVIFAIIRYKKTAIIMIALLAFLGGGTGYMVTKIPVLYNTQAVQTVVTRIKYQYIENDGDKEETLDNMTSGRTGQWKKYIGYFNEQDIINKMFGGNVLTTTTMDPYFKENFSHGPHQAYIGFMINFGVVGLAVVMLAFVIKILSLFFKAVKSHDENELVLFMTSYAWLVYGMALDYFFDTRFMTFFFL